jgi:hypothetical protein
MGMAVHGIPHLQRRASGSLSALLAAVLAAGCFSSSRTNVVGPEKLAQLISQSPHVTRKSQTEYEPRTDADSIEFYYFRFHALNAPNLLRNWKYHHIIKPASKPEWQYTKIADVSVYLQKMDDDAAHAEFRTLAHDLGGDAVVGMYRKPVVTRRPGPWLGTPIAAYRYVGIVVRRE